MVPFNFIPSEPIQLTQIAEDKKKRYIQNGTNILTIDK